MTIEYVKTAAIANNIAFCVFKKNPSQNEQYNDIGTAFSAILAACSTTYWAQEIRLTVETVRMFDCDCLKLSVPVYLK